MDYLNANKNSWNNRVDEHLSSDFYDMPGFLAGESSLKEIELPLLGDIAGKTILHLQCHFGQDSLCLSRMGAKVTGVDLSDKAIAKAREINAQLNLDARFIECDIYSLPEHLDEQFDIVFTSYGTIGWLPDINKWGALVSRYLKPGGRFIFAEFHPFIWTFDDDVEKVTYRYFNTEPIVDEMKGTYANPDADIGGIEISWNHSISEVLSALMGNGLNLTHFGEYDFTPWNCFANLEESEPGRFRFKQHGNMIPITYSIVAEKGTRR